MAKSNILHEISTHKAVKEDGQIRVYIKGFEIDELKYEDEFLYCLDSEDDIPTHFDFLEECNRINVAEFMSEIGQ